jgi:hypothetical protein
MKKHASLSNRTNTSISRTELKLHSRISLRDLADDALSTITGGGGSQGGVIMKCTFAGCTKILI